MGSDLAQAADPSPAEPNDVGDPDSAAPARASLVTVHLRNFRNLGDILLEPAPGLNVLEGANGQGKTNVLESGCLLAGLRSFRGARFADMIGPAGPTFELAARVSGGRGEQVVELTGAPRGRRIRVDERPVRRTSALLEVLPVVFFGPDDLAVTKAGPAHRRALLDEGVVLCDPGRAPELRRYQEVVRERNRALRQVAEGAGA